MARKKKNILSAAGKFIKKVNYINDTPWINILIIFASENPFFSNVSNIFLEILFSCICSKRKDKLDFEELYKNKCL